MKYHQDDVILEVFDVKFLLVTIDIIVRNYEKYLNHIKLYNHQELNMLEINEIMVNLFHLLNVKLMNQLISLLEQESKFHYKNYSYSQKELTKKIRKIIKNLDEILTLGNNPRCEISNLAGSRSVIVSGGDGGEHNTGDLQDSNDFFV